MKQLLVLAVAFVLVGCSGNTNLPRVSLMGVPVGGSNAYCTGLSAGVGALAGGVLSAFLAPTQTAQMAAIGTFSGAAAGGASGYLMCPATPAATPASESIAS
jgi:hypothetical protein